MVKNLIGIGVDIEDISRFSQLSQVRDEIFLQKIFTPSELTYCFTKKLPGQHLAARFAAKEAAVKAFSSFVSFPVDMKDIEICNKNNGSPYLVFHNQFAKNIEGHVSLSHEKDKAIAFCILTKK